MKMIQSYYLVVICVSAVVKTVIYNKYYSVFKNIAKIVLVPYLAVRWLKDEEFLMESPQGEAAFIDRFHLLANGSLEVMNIQTEDTGKYYCEILTSAGKAVQNHAIEVQYPPRIYTTPSGFIEMPIGAVLEVICEAAGVPQPVISWDHNNQSITYYLVGNRQVHVVDIKSRNMSGSIKCIGRNGVGEPVSDGVELMVLCKYFEIISENVLANYISFVK